MRSTRSLSTIAPGFVVSLFILPLVVPLPAQAGVEFFNVDADSDRWLEALAAAGALPEAIVDFSLLPDFGIGHSEPAIGPLCAEGNNIVPPGFLPPDLCLATPIHVHLDYVGPSAGFGNTKNAVVAGYFVDNFDIDMAEPKLALEVFALSFLGGESVDISVFDPDGVLIGQLTRAAIGGSSGGRWGILATNGDRLSLVNITDPESGAEGVMDLTLFGFECPQDLDGDGAVGAADLAILLASWGPCETCPADFNADNVVDAADLAQLLGAWGMCP